MKTIRTRYNGAGLFRKAGITATGDGKTLKVGYDPGISLEDNHRRAAQALFKQNGGVGMVMSSGKAKFGVHTFEPALPPQRKARGPLEDQMMRDLGL